MTENVTRELVNDLLCTALDGGVGGSWYWLEDYKIKPVDNLVTQFDLKEYYAVQYRHDALAAGATMLFKAEDDETEYVLTLDDFVYGLQLYCENFQCTISKLVDDHDADDADNVLQYALFKKCIYG